MQANTGIKGVAYCLTLLMLLSGCAGNWLPYRPGHPGAMPDTAQADRLAASGDLRDAAAAYKALALETEPPARQNLQLRAGDALLRAGDFAQAGAVFDQIETGGLHPSYEQRKRLLGARIALAEKQPDTALNLLPDVPEDISPALQVQLHTTRAQAYKMAGNALENARERVRLDTLLGDPAARHANHSEIWSALGTLSLSVLEQLRTTPPPDVFSGWMELAGIARPGMRDAALPANIRNWQQRYPKHPANSDIIPALLGKPEAGAGPAAGNGYPPHLAVLLPLSGKYAKEAQALRNGMLTAYYRQRWGGTPPQLRFYDTGANDTGLRQYYDQAVKDGAGLVIGPLTKAAVTDLARSGPLSAPVLALNQVDVPPPARFYQYALAPEDEARQVAERASLDGYTNALAVVPAGEWGAHLLQEFTQRFQQLGGNVTAVQRYGASTDFEALARQLLGDSAATQTPPGDLLFMVAFPDQARLIVNQVRGAGAAALPVYATSHSYTGRNSYAAELDGVIFCDIPWMLSPSSLASGEYTRSAQLWPDSMLTHPRLYAMGIDAYNIIPYLGRIGDSAITGYPGESGQLYLDSARRLHRQLMWARHAGGGALPIDASPPNRTYYTSPP